MAVLKCKMCGGDLSIAQDATTAECQYCGCLQTIPCVQDENLQGLYNRANLLRRRSEFDKAEQLYEKIVQADETQAEAYWGLILCKYGIEYVEDPATFKRIPTCHRTSLDSVMTDADYQAALENADLLQRRLYEQEAQEIDRLQRDIIALSKKEEPYDVFICYKQTDEQGKRTRDSVIANDIYHQLTQEGLKVFYAAISLEDKLGSAYEPCIFAALTSAKVMLVIGTNPDYFNAVWVKNEWGRFLKMMKKDRSKLLIPCYKDMDAYELPEEFSHLQAQDMGKIGFINDVVRGIKKLTVAEKPQPVVQAPRGNVIQLILQDETMYEGEAFAGVPHGLGKAMYLNGDVYEGHWHRGKMHGQGTMTWSSGEKWTGEFKDGKVWDGQGVCFLEENGTRLRYEGRLSNGLKCDSREREYDDRTYLGEWVDGKEHGQGIITWKEGGQWIGEFVNGKAWNGSGVYYIAENGKNWRYEGDLRNGIPYGNGEREYDNYSYTGQWVSGQQYGQGTITWKKGGQWTGEFKDGQAWTGKGIYYFDNNGLSQRYEGEFLNGKCHGYGEREYTEYSYAGQWVEGKMHGQGTITWKKGGQWTGEFKNFCANNGRGVYYFRTNGQHLRYEGEMVNGKCHGYGEREYTEYSYAGQWVEGKMHGQGTMTWKKGGQWTGEFKDGQAWTGRGVYYFDNNGLSQRYEGEFLNGKCHGYGERDYTEYTYAGQWIGGKKQGQGTITWKKGGQWTGEFKDGNVWTGKGVYYVVNKEGQSQRYEGEVRNTFWHGYGVYEYPDYTYAGQWVEGKQHGQGTITWKKGGQWTGEFKDGQAWTGKGVYYVTKKDMVQRYEGEILNSFWHGYGVYEYPDCTYAGQWGEGKQHGQGTITWKKGGQWTGEFKDGKAWIGKGVYYFAHDGQLQRYEGEILSGKCHGYGEKEYSDGKYLGRWANGQPHGKGKMLWNTGEQWVGELKNGAPWSGKGVWYNDCGRKLSGRFMFGRCL